MKKLLLIIGIPGSGKSTMANKIKSENPEFFDANIWEADMFFMKDGEYKWNPDMLWFAHKWCQAKVELDMKQNKNVIVSNTNLTSLERKPYIKLAKKYGYEIEVIECNGGFKNIHDVPDETIERMKKKYKPFEKWELNVK